MHKISISIAPNTCCCYCFFFLLFIFYRKPCSCYGKTRKITLLFISLGLNCNTAVVLLNGILELKVSAQMHSSQYVSIATANRNRHNSQQHIRFLSTGFPMYWNKNRKRCPLSFCFLYSLLLVKIDNNCWMYASW